MRKFIYLFLAFICSVTAGQTQGVWQNFTDLKVAREVVSMGGNVVAATSGGAYFFNQIDSTFTILTKANGLLSQNLRSLNLDNNNRVWFGAEDGTINIYDISSKNMQSILDIFRSDKKKKSIRDLFISGDTIFVSTDFGLSIIDSEEMILGDTFLKFGEFPTETGVVSTVKYGLIYICTDRGVAIQKTGANNLTAPESWETYSLGSKISATEIYKILNFENNILLATNRGIMKFSNSRWEPFIFTNLNVKDFFALHGNLYVVQGKSVYSYNQADSTKLLFSSTMNINSISVSGNNEIVVSLDDGVEIFDGTTVRKIVPNGPNSNLFSGIAIDINGNLWAASGKDVTGVGFYKYDGSEWTNYNFANTPILKSNAYHKVFSGNNGKIYICNWGQGFIEIDNGEFKRYDTKNSPMQGISDNPDFLVISSVQTDSKGNAWSLNFWSDAAEPLAALTPDSTWYTYKFSNPAVTNRDLMDIFAIDQYDTKWFTVRNKGLYYFNESNTLENTNDDISGRITSIGGLGSGSINALTVDNQGELWVGKNPGINIIVDPANPQQSRIIDLPAFRNQLITFIAVDPINRKWVGTKTGVFLMSPDGLTVLQHYDSNNSPLPNDDIKSIAINSKNGTVFIGTDFGLSSLTTDAVSPLRSNQELFVYPNPLVLDNTNSLTLNIKGLIKDSGLKIYAITGKLIREIFAGTADSPGGSIAHWDGRNDNGNLVPSGVYLIVAHDRDGSNVSTTKVAVLRK